MGYYNNQGGKLLFSLLFLGYINTVIAQNGASVLPQPIPPSPTAASLGKFGDIPVGYYTGTPNISIPLYEIKTKDLSLPITLSYDANGLRVAQDASWVGLGWSLSAGGLVSRVVRGNDDLSNSYGYHNYKLLPWQELPQNSLDSSFVGQYYKDIISGQVDSEPDVFSYNFAGYSGKFTIDKQLNGGKVFQSKRDNLKIEYNPGLSFTITTPDGNKYDFTTKEAIANLYTDTFTGAGTDPSDRIGLASFNHASEAVNSSWYLDKITSPAGDVITFIYKSGHSLSLISRNEKQFLNQYIRAISPNATPPPLLYETKVDSREHIEDVMLERIEFANGRVEFETSVREDIEAYSSTILPQKLSGIRVYNNSQVAPIKEIIFDHSYFDTFNPYGSRYYEKRLKLDDVQVDQSGNKYSFSYYKPTELPSKYSRQVDEWGFYTGYFDNPFTYTTSFHYPDLYPRVMSPSGTVDGVPQLRGDITGDYLKRGILTSITYPTKGKTEFDYEPHDYGNADPIFNKVTQIALLDFTDPDPNNQISGSENALKTFTVPEATNVNVTAITSYNSSDAVQIGYLRNANGDLLHIFSTIQGNPTGATYGSDSYSAYLPAGQYTIEAHELSGQMTRLTALYDERQPNDVTLGGGLRVKSITNYDSNNAVAEKKTFGYHTGQQSTGILLKKATDYYFKTIVYNSVFGYPGDVSGGDYLVRSSNSLFPDGFYTLPNLVGYSKVSVTDDINGNNGTTVFNFYNVEPVDENHPEYYPDKPVPFNSRNGQLLSVEVLNASGNLVKKTAYEYIQKEKYSVLGFKVFRAPFDPVYTVLWDDGHTYDNFSEWWVQSKKTETSYFNNGTQSVVTEQADNYDNASHKQITSSQVVSSDQTTRTTFYKYPHEFSSQEPYATMIARNMIGPVIEKSIYKNNDTSPLEVTKTNYDFWLNINWSSNAASALTVPRTVEIQKQGSSSETRLQYHNYDNQGSILSVSKAGGSKTSYVWGYNQQYPIAECKNATNTEFYYEGFEESTASGVTSGIAHTGNKYTTNATVTWTLPNSRTYMISYWYLNSGIWTYSGEQAFTGSFTMQSGASGYDDIRIYPADAQMTTYTYQPLVGMTSSTDARGQTTHYEYDSFQRLMNVKDQYGNILKHTDYHYQNQ